MRFPDKTPLVVRKAVRLYVHTRRLLLICTTLMAGVAGAGFVVAVFCIVDRFVEWEAAGRAAGPWLALVLLAIAVVAFVGIAILYRPGALHTAIHLDQAFPANQDRWATALDLVTRAQAGEQVGAATCVDRLLAETEDRTAANPVPRVVRKRNFAISLLALLLTGAAFCFLYYSTAFDLPLLWRRFWHPADNLPRDSSAVIKIVGVNGRTLREGVLEPIPENSRFAVAVQLGRKDADLFGFAKAPPSVKMLAAAESASIGLPELEILSEGQIRKADFRRAGAVWQSSVPRLSNRMTFRVRADDALTQWYVQDIIPRIRVHAVTHSIRYPRYVRLEDVEKRPLTTNRLSILTDSRLELYVTCNKPYQSIQATFEAIQEEGADQPRVVYGGDYGEILMVERPGQKAGVSKPRPLRVKRHDPASGRIRLTIAESGIVRIKALGENGVYSAESIYLIDAIVDAPPRITLTGLDPDMQIVPGEVIAVQYRVEDDFGVADLIMRVMDTDIHSQAHEVYLPSQDFGKKIIEGQEIVQRMDYRVYGDWPLTIQLLAYDYKGQEARSQEYRIHLVRDEYWRRFERGMEFLNSVAGLAGNWRRALKALDNQLNILADAVGKSQTCPPKHKKLLDRFANTIRRQRMRSASLDSLRYGDVPDRLVESGILLALPSRLMRRREQLLELASGMKESDDLPTVIRQIRGLIQENLQLAAAWEAAARAEVKRFLPESIIQRARKPAQGLVGLERSATNAALREANLARQLDQIPALSKAAAALAQEREDVAALLKALDAAREQKDAKLVLAALHSLIDLLAEDECPPSDALVGLGRDIAETALRDDGRRARVTSVLAAMLRLRGDREILQPTAIVRLARMWLQEPKPADESWYFTALEPHDVWLALDGLCQALSAHRLNVLAGRYELDTRAGHDREAELRELSIVARGIVGRCPGLDDGVKQKVKSLLAPFTSDRFSLHLSRPGWEGLDELDAFVERQLSRLAPLAPRLHEDTALLVSALRDLAERYESHIRAIQTLLPQPDRLALGSADQRRLAGEAADSLARLEALDVFSRSLLFLRVYEKLMSEPPQRGWRYWELCHGGQRDLTLAVGQASTIARAHAAKLGKKQEIAMGAEPDWGKKYLNIVGNCNRLMSKLAEQADRLAMINNETSLPKDATPQAPDSDRALYLSILEREFRNVEPFLVGADPDRAAVRDRLAASALGRVSVNGCVLLRLIRHRSKLRAYAAGTVSSVAAQLRALRETLTMLGGSEASQDVDALLRDTAAEAASARFSGLPVLARKLRSLDAQLAEEIDSLRPTVHPPPVAKLAKRYRDAQRRWLAHLCETELSLLRELAAPALAAPRRLTSPRRLVLQYARMVEARARNVFRQGRRNRPPDVDVEDTGLAIRLPKHIAKEFVKARNRKSPAEFRADIEDYFAELYRDLAD